MELFSLTWPPNYVKRTFAVEDPTSRRETNARTFLYHPI